MSMFTVRRVFCGAGAAAAGVYFGKHSAFDWNTVLFAKEDPKQVEIQKIKELFTLDTAKLKDVQKHFHAQMQLGLAGGVSSMKMLPSYVERLPTGNETGSYLALDLGGTNFRVLEVKLQDGVANVEKEIKTAIPHSIMTGTGSDLFAFIARAVARNGSAGDLGFTFSFPVEQNTLNSGTLVEWTKGFTASDVVGHDIVDMLQKALKNEGMHINVKALCNDTVGTLITKAFSNSDCQIGVILGTGSNACYVEKKKNIKKINPDPNDETPMIINMEWGGFGSNERDHLPVTAFDAKVDRLSPNPGKQIFEKMLSGMYFSRVVQEVMLYYSQVGVLRPSPLLSVQDSITGADVSAILTDNSADLNVTSAILQRHLFLDTTLEERQVVRDTCKLVRNRSARLSGMAIATVAEHIGATGHMTVGVDGSVYQHVPGFKRHLDAAVQELLDPKTLSIHSEHARDGSGLGAALVACLYH